MEEEIVTQAEMDAMGLGATGKFPDGKAHPLDEGQLNMAVGGDKKRQLVKLAFGKPVAWLAFPPAQARVLAQAILEKADEVENG